MIVVYAFVILMAYLVGYIFWPKDNRSLLMVNFTALIIGAILMLAIYITQWWPVEHKVTQTVVRKYVNPPKVVYRNRDVFRIPGQEYAPVNPKEICGGSRPVQILTIDVVSKDSEATTWVIVKPMGSMIKITCSIPGDLHDFWKIGDVTQFTQGKPQ